MLRGAPGMLRGAPGILRELQECSGEPREGGTGRCGKCADPGVKHSLVSELYPYFTLTHQQKWGGNLPDPPARRGSVSQTFPKAGSAPQLKPSCFQGREVALD